MEIVGNIKLARLLIIMIWMCTVAASVISYNYPLEPSTEGDEDRFDFETPEMDDLKRVRSLLTAPGVKLSEVKRSEDSSEEHAEQKRINFGFSGLDTVDYILTTLEKTPKPARQNVRASQVDKDKYYLMKVNG
uniref:Uncharacterized protein n=1 Tax=Arion vulgaris TaxID=1028688 RepID=A0A0B6Y790_9EUPU